MPFFCLYSNFLATTPIGFVHITFQLQGPSFNREPIVAGPYSQGLEVQAESGTTDINT